MSNTRMVVVVRRDLNMPSGLLAAQTLHTGMEFIRTRRLTTQVDQGPESSPAFSQEELEWIVAPYVSVLAVDTPEELAIIEKTAIDENLQTHRWTDVVPSKILNRSISCVVGISIGPADADKIKVVTGTLPLF